MNSADFPDINPDELTRPFWEACAERRLVVQTCSRCGHRQYPPMHYCGECQSAGLFWEGASGEGVLHSVSTVFRPQSPAFKSPYVVAIAEMAEGWFMMSNVIRCEPSQVIIGQQVRVAFTEIRAGYVLPHFVLAI